MIYIEKDKICVIGGDSRMIYAGVELAKKGFEVAAYANESLETPSELTKAYTLESAAENARCVLLPLPCFSSENIIFTPFCNTTVKYSDIKSIVPDDTLIFGGMLGKQKERKNVYDYFLREELQILNAIPTAEGAIKIALQERKETLSEAKILITGFGRIGKTLAVRLRDICQNVTVAARSEKDLAWATALGINSIKLNGMNGFLSGFDIIYNTVPSELFNKNNIRLFKKGALFIELASAPGGIADGCNAQTQIKIINAKGLPGKTAPITAGKIIAHTVFSIINEENNI